MSKNKSKNKNVKKANKGKTKKQNSTSANKKGAQVKKLEQEMKYDAEEGTFYEKMFHPTSVTIGHNKEGERTAILEDQHGEKMRVTGNQVVRRLFRTLVVQLTKEKETAPVWAKNDKQASAFLTEIMIKRLQEKPEKPPILKFLLNDKKEAEGVSSKIHKQIPWSQVRHIVESAIKEAYGTVDLRKDGETFRWDYRLPFESDYVGAFASIYRGNNLLRGASALRIQGRLRTEREDFGGAPACMNWASYALGALSEVIGRIEKIPTSEELEMLTAKHVHVLKTFAEPEKAIQELTAQFKQLEKGVKEMNKRIAKSIKTPLQYNEMKEILWAYDEKVKIPSYIITAITERARKQGEETVWAFSQAVSWVRTHGDLRETKRSRDRELRDIVRKLENIAGEVLSLAPTINTYHEKRGPITFEDLIPKPKKPKDARERKLAVAVTTEGETAVSPEEAELSSIAEMSDAELEATSREAESLEG